MITEGLHEATVVFGVSKGLNAAVSLAQGTEVGPPGVTFTIGEVLDPINDLVERFSWVMLASIASLGVQKILLLIVTGPFFQALFILTLAAGNILLYLRFKNDRRVRRVVFKSAAVLVFLRFSIPLMALLNAHVYENYVKKEYNISALQTQITQSTGQINATTAQTLQRDTSFFEGLSNIFNYDFYKQKLAQYKKSAAQVSDHVLHLLIAFVFKAIFFPLLFLMLLYGLIKSVFAIGVNANLTKSDGLVA